MEIKSCLEGLVYGNFRLGKRLGSGSFGEIFLGTDDTTGQEFAIKIEPALARPPQLDHESRIYKILQSGYGVHIPCMKSFFYEEKYDANIMAIDLLGPSLEDLFQKCNRKFTLKTVLLLADQMISRLEFMHSHYFFHRDMKPDNFLIGVGEQKNVVFIIDFGLARKYWDTRENRHLLRESIGGGMMGTARYASINTHLGLEYSRREDMESLGYVLMYLLRGSLPWQGLPSRGMTKKEKYQLILERKQATCPDLLCQGYPNEFLEYFVSCAKLGYEDQPDYTYLKGIFRTLYINLGYEDDGVFDWDASPKQLRKSQKSEKLHAKAAGVAPASAARLSGKTPTMTSTPIGGWDVGQEIPTNSGTNNINAKNTSYVNMGATVVSSSSTPAREGVKRPPLRPSSASTKNHSGAADGGEVVQEHKEPQPEVPVHETPFTCLINAVANIDLSGSGSGSPSGNGVEILGVQRSGKVKQGGKQTTQPAGWEEDEYYDEYLGYIGPSKSVTSSVREIYPDNYSQGWTQEESSQKTSSAAASAGGVASLAIGDGGKTITASTTAAGGSAGAGL